jgi:hypothetical protein
MARLAIGAIQGHDLFVGGEAELYGKMGDDVRKAA